MIVCALLLIAFALLCYGAVSTKSVTSDEPLHVTGAYAHVFMRDFRLNPEDPPLWNYWVMLPRSSSSLHLPTDDELWSKQMIDTAYGMPYASVVLFTSENNGAQFVQSCRAMMVPLGVMLGAIIAIWAWQIAGKGAAIVGTTLFAFDPNFLAHAGLVKNDVALALIMTAMSFALWRVGRRATWMNVACASLLLGAGMATKFSGVLLVPIFIAMMAARALLQRKWLSSAGICAIAAVVAWTVIWMSYGFRFDPTRETGARLPMPHIVTRTAEERFFIQHNRWPSEAETTQADAGLVAHAVVWAERYRLLPQAWLYGFLYTYQSTLIRAAFLCGQIRQTGWWYYFPLAMLFKTPIGTIGAALSTLAVAVAAKRQHPEAHSASDGRARWTLACLVIPLVIYLSSAMTSNLNLGIRHVLPIYPFVYLLVANAAVSARSLRPRAFKLVSATLGLVLVLETLAAFPNYLSFFNLPSRPYRLKLLSDSNIDWGQDLLALSRWQADHPRTRLYLCYFGSVDPAAYGIDYINLPGGTYFNKQEQAPDAPGVIAISASRLQGVHLSPELREFYGKLLKQQQPIDVLGGSIYLFDYPARVRRDESQSVQSRPWSNEFSRS